MPEGCFSNVPHPPAILQKGAFWPLHSFSPTFHTDTGSCGLHNKSRYNILQLLMVYLEKEGPSLLILKLLPPLLMFKYSVGELGSWPMSININLCKIFILDPVSKQVL